MNEKKKLTIKEIFDLALQNHKKNNFQIAEKLYREILNVDPNNFQSTFLLGTLLGQAKNFDLAKQLLQKAIKINPTDMITAYRRMLDGSIICPTMLCTPRSRFGMLSKS